MYGSWYHSASTGTVGSSNLTFAGDVSFDGNVTNLRGRQLAPEFPGGSSAAAAPVSGTTYALYLGNSPCRIRSLQASVVVGAAAASGVSWAELALATGTFESNSGITAGTPELTLVPGGFASISAAIAAGTNRAATATITPTTAIDPGTELWLLFGISATSLPTMRVFGDTKGLTASVAATRPSTMSANTALTSGTIAAPIIFPDASALVLT